MSFPTDAQLRAICLAAKFIQAVTYPVNMILYAFQTPSAPHLTATAQLNMDYMTMVNSERQ